MENIKLDEYLKLKRCPHCSVDNPNLLSLNPVMFTTADNGINKRAWRFYRCGRCGGIVTAAGNSQSFDLTENYPSANQVNDILPSRVKSYLQQAIDSTFAPSGSTILCASAVDAMLKEKGYRIGSLYKRIETAVTDGLITHDMAKWAHQIRLEANDERHSDEETDMPSIIDAKQSIEFTQTLAELLFVLPSKVSRGIEATKK